MANEVRFEIIEESKKSAGTKIHKQKAVINSDIEVRQTKRNATTESSPTQNEPKPGNPHPTITPDPIINYNEWSVYQNKVFLDHERTLILIDKYVKNEMFHQLKFISHPEMMIFSWEPQSICQVICTKFNVPKNGRVSFWSQYSKPIIQKLNKKRSDVSNAMRKAFKGK